MEQKKFGIGETLWEAAIFVLLLLAVNFCPALDPIDFPASNINDDGGRLFFNGAILFLAALFIITGLSKKKRRQP